MMKALEDEADSDTDHVPPWDDPGDEDHDEGGISAAFEGLLDEEITDQEQQAMTLLTLQTEESQALSCIEVAG